MLTVVASKAIRLRMGIPTRAYRVYFAMEMATTRPKVNRLGVAVRLESLNARIIRSSVHVTHDIKVSIEDY